MQRIFKDEGCSRALLWRNPVGTGLIFPAIASSVACVGPATRRPRLLTAAKMRSRHDYQLIVHRPWPVFGKTRYISNQEWQVLLDFWGRRVLVVACKNERNQQFADYWDQLRAENDGAIPRWSQFKPETVPRLLPNLIVYELESDELIRIRLQGTAINDRFGQNMTGGNYLDFVNSDRRHKASEAFWVMVNQPCGQLAVLVHRLSSGRDITVESVGFPFVNDKGGAPIVIYQSHEIEDFRPADRIEAERLQIILVMERCFLDLGNGIPDFYD